MLAMRHCCANAAAAPWPGVPSLALQVRAAPGAACAGTVLFPLSSVITYIAPRSEGVMSAVTPSKHRSAAMSWIDRVGGLLQRYSTASGSPPPPSTAADFASVAESAPATALSGGLAAAFRSGNTPFGELISQLFAQSDPTQRAGILGHLLAAAGPAAVSSGALAGAGLTPAPGAAVSPEQAQQVPVEAVRGLAEAAAKNDPSIIDRASEFYAQHPALIKSMGAGALAVVMSHLSQHH
jgi:hypothetical protein